MNNNIPSSLWGQYDTVTFRFNGNLEWQPTPPGSNWNKLQVANVMSFISGDIPWNHLARTSRSTIAVIDPSVDLRYLHHIPSHVWQGSNFVSERWTKVPYIPVDVPKIEPDNWDLFWELWDKEKDRIKREANEPDYWRGVMIYLNETIDPSNFNFNTTPISDWTMHFPKMFDAIRNAVPFKFIEKIVLWQNVREIDPHFDPDHWVLPWPDSLRVMLHDTNKKPTLYMTKWPKRDENYNPPPITSIKGGDFGTNASSIDDTDKFYVEVPEETNTFLLNNGAFLHGADMGTEKIIMAIKGTPDHFNWLKSLESSYNKYKRDDYDSFFKS